MTLFEVLFQFGFDINARTKMARHKDNREEVDFDALIASDRFEEYQQWQHKPVFHNAEFLISFIGHEPKKARFWGLYRINGCQNVREEDLPRDHLPWPWKPGDHFRYDLTRLNEFDLLVDSLVIEWSSERRWDQNLKDNKVLACPPLHDIDLPNWDPLFSEGKKFVQIAVSRRRSKEARDACLKIHGATCAVCEMTFPESYNGLGIGFMHVHHQTEISSQNDEYEIRPKEDLCPVCPNCHAMLHWNVDTPRTIAELRNLVTKK